MGGREVISRRRRSHVGASEAKDETLLSTLKYKLKINACKYFSHRTQLIICLCLLSSFCPCFSFSHPLSLSLTLSLTLSLSHTRFLSPSLSLSLSHSFASSLHPRKENPLFSIFDLLMVWTDNGARWWHDIHFLDLPPLIRGGGEEGRRGGWSLIYVGKRVHYQCLLDKIRFLSIPFFLFD